MKQKRNRYPEHEAQMKKEFFDYPCDGCTSKFCSSQSYETCPHWRSWFYRAWRQNRILWEELARKKG